MTGLLILEVMAWCAIIIGVIAFGALLTLVWYE